MSDQPIRILLVEDNPTDVLLLEEALAQVTSARFEVSHAERLAEAVQRLSQDSFDVVLLDLSLPDSQGLTTLVQVREQSPRMPIVVLTGLTDEAFGLKALQEGAQDYLVKGQVDGHGLVRAIRYAIERERAEEETQRHNRELTLLNQVIAAAAFGQEPETILETVCYELAQAFYLPRVNAVLLDAEHTEATIVAEFLTGTGPAGLNQRFQIARNPAIVHLLSHQGPLAVADIRHNPHLAPFQDLARQSGVAALLTVPLVVDRKVIGSLNLCAAQPRHFSAEEISLAWGVADQVSRALAYSQLIQTQQRLSAAVEQATESMIITDIKGTIIYVNPAFERNSGYSRAEAIGQTPRLLKSGQHEAAFYQELWSTISAGQVWRGRFTNRGKDGTLYIEEASITPVHHDTGEIVNYVAVQRDVTRELQLEEQYRQAQKMEAVGRLSGGVAHDFNNLLVVITGYSELLLQRHLDQSSPIRHHVEEIEKAGRRAASLTRQLLAFSRQQVLQPEILNLNEIVANIEKMLRRLIGEDIALAAILQPELGLVKADPGQVEQVLLNLVVNARDAMPKGGKLTIETTNVELDKGYALRHVEVAPGPYVMLAVSDTGTGMDLETQRHIFEPFFTTKEKDKGTGLGLATVYGIVKQSGGTIWVYSEVGQGTTFKVYLPRLGEITPVAAKLVDSVGTGAGTETILLVEDEEIVRNLARQILEMSGYTVLEASQGVEALELVQQQPEIHALITDVVMPGGINGRELAEQLKLLCPQLKVLYMSGYTDDAIVHHGVLGRDLFFLQKPFTPQALTRKIRAVLDAPA